MSAIAYDTATPASPFGRPGAGIRLRWAISDSLTMTTRNLRLWVRVPANLIFTVVQPAMFVLLFRYVFGGAIPVHIKGGYPNYLIPGILAQTGAFTSFGTAYVPGPRAQEGVHRPAPLDADGPLGSALGRLGADVVRLAVTTSVLIVLGYAVGFRFENGVVAAGFMLVVALSLGIVLCCVSVFTGLAIKDEEAVQAFGFIWVFPLTFVSAAFVPIRSMPGWMQGFAYNQPFTVVIETMRSLAVGGPLAAHAWQSAAWLVGLGTLFAALAIRAYRRV